MISSNSRLVGLKLASLTATTILCSGLMVPAAAQTTAPAVSTIDENGIELTTLTYSDTQELVSVGSGTFPSRLYVARTGDVSTNNTNLNITLSAANGTTLGNNTHLLFLTINGVQTFFSWDGSADRNGNLFLPSIYSNGQSLPQKNFIVRTLENGISIYTYYSSQGDQIRFETNNTAVCGRENNLAAVQYISCEKAISWTSPNRVAATFSYDNSAMVTQVTNTLGLQLSLNYQPYKDSGKYTSASEGLTSVIASSNQLGSCNAQPTCSRSVSFQYAVAPPDGAGSENPTNIVLTASTDSVGNITRYLYDDLNTHFPSLTGIRRPTSPSQNSLSITRNNNTSPRTTLVSDALGNGWLYSTSLNQNNNHRLILRTDPLGKHRSYELDENGYLISFTNELNNITQWQYDNHGQIIQKTNPNGIIEAYTYDVRGNVTSSALKAYPPGSAPDIVTSAQFDTICSNPKTCNKPSATTDALGNQTFYIYDGNHGGVVAIVGPAAAAGQPQPQATFVYSTVSGAYALTGTSTCRTTSSCSGTSDETRTRIGYGASGLLPITKTVQAGDGSIQSTINSTYDAIGNLVSQTGPVGGDTRYSSYDQMGRVIGDIDADPDGGGARGRSAHRYTYNGDGRLVTVEAGTVTSQATDLTGFSAAQTLQTTYDGNGQKIGETLLGAGNVIALTQYSYDAAGQLLCKAQRMDPSAFGSPPADACTLGTAGSNGYDRITQNGYDAAGQFLNVTHVLPLEFVMTPQGSRKKPPVIDVTVAYTPTGPNGQVQSLTDSNGNVTNYAYDGFNRLQTASYADGSYEQLSYDANSNIKSQRLRDGQVIAYVYDNLNRLVSKDVPNSVYWETDKGYDYDLVGHLTGARDSNGRTLGFAYDALGNKTSQSDSWYAFGNAQFQYDAAGRRTKTTWNDGFFVSYDRDARGGVTAIRENGTTVLTSFGYDDLGGRTSISRANGTVTGYIFDAIERLAQLTHYQNGGAVTQQYTVGYNPASQVISRSTSNDSYAFTQAYNISRDYTVNGLNQYTQSGGVGLSYDGRGNLTNSGSSTYTYTSENRMATAGGGGLAYDPLDRLFNVQENGVNTTLLYDGANVIAEVDQNNNGALLRRYVHGPGTDEPLVWYEGAGTTDRRWLHADERGSIVAVTNDAGNVIAINSYDEFGIPASGNVGRFQYTGQKWLPSAGLYDYKARMYSPTLGRFMQTDPIGYSDGMNAYSYVGGDPINSIDPTGLDQCSNASPYALPCLTASTTSASSSSSSSSGGYDFSNNVYGHDFGGQDALFALARNAPINQLRSATYTSPQNTCGRLSSLDPTIQSAVGGYNAGRGLSQGSAEFLDPTLVEAMVAVESGHSAAAYNSDPMQVNNPGDWDPTKQTVGLTRGAAPGQALGIQAGVSWLSYKAYGRSTWNGPLYFRGWDSAVSRYNGGGDPNYLKKVKAAQAAIKGGC